MKRVFWIVLDSCGIGAMPDAAAFGDAQPHTMRRISASSAFSVPQLLSLGLGNIDGQDYLPGTDSPLAAVARLAEQSAGKDTTIGHWEMAGLISNQPLPTYPDGFPDEVLLAFSSAVGRGVLCNKPYSGTEVIADYGEQHIKTGDLIVYTSADSVFQIAAHEEVVPVEQLYEYCRIARRLLQGKHGVGRVIARPFAGQAPHFVRTANRRDFSLQPPSDTLLDYLSGAGKTVWGIGKISDIFAGRGITRCDLTHGNAEGMEKTIEAAKERFEGLCFVNLVDFDMLYGHRQDVDGYAAALTAFDCWLPELFSLLKRDDVLIITADHGCDPGDNHTDHTREYVPMLMYGERIRPVNLGTRASFSDISATVAEYLNVPYTVAGESFLPLVIKE